MNAEFQFKHEIPVQIRFSDVDQYGHMNNSVYFSLYDLAKTSYFRDVFGAEECNKFSVVVVNINADFLAPVSSRMNWSLKQPSFTWDTKASRCCNVHSTKPAVC